MGGQAPIAGNAPQHENAAHLHAVRFRRPLVTIHVAIRGDHRAVVKLTLRQFEKVVRRFAIGLRLQEVRAAAVSFCFHLRDVAVGILDVR